MSLFRDLADSFFAPHRQTYGAKRRQRIALCASAPLRLCGYWSLGGGSMWMMASLICGNRSINRSLTT